MYSYIGAKQTAKRGIDGMRLGAEIDNMCKIDKIFLEVIAGEKMH